MNADSYLCISFPALAALNIKNALGFRFASPSVAGTPLCFFRSRFFNDLAPVVAGRCFL